MNKRQTRQEKQQAAKIAAELAEKQAAEIAAQEAASQQENNAQPETTQEAEQEKKVYSASIKTFADIEAMDAEEKTALLRRAQTSARKTYGVSSEPSKDAAGAVRYDVRNRIIPQYTPRREANVVAADELARLQRLHWAQTARTFAAEMASKLGRSLTEQEIVSCLNRANMPDSYSKKKASKPLFSRVLASMNDAATFKASN